MSTRPPEDTGAGMGVEDYAEESAFYRFSALLGLAAAAVFAAAVVTYSASGAFTKEVLALLVVAAVLGVLYFIPRAGEAGAWLRTRSARQGGNVTLASVALLGVLVVGNWLANRHAPQWDLTAARRYTLSDQSMKVLNGLPSDVKVTAFISRRYEDSFTRGAVDLLRQYERKSSKIRLEVIDPDINPGAARQYDIRTVPITIFEMGERKEETTGLTEQDFTSALLKLSRTEKKKVYFLQGHQERDPNSAQAAGYTAVTEALQRENYETATLLLPQTQTVPADAAVLVIAGPRAPLLDWEIRAVEEYVERGGRLLLLLDPRLDSGLEALLDRWYVKVGNDIVVDPGSNFQGDALTPLPLPQVGHRISTSLTLMILPGARSVSVKPGAGSDFAIAPLLKTTDRAWGETNFNQQPRFDPGEDAQGPLTLAVAVYKTDPAPTFNPAATPTPTPASGATPKGRIVTIGNSEFATNALFTQVPGNRDLMINSINWLAEEEDLISIRADAAAPAPIVLSNQSLALIQYTTVVFIPLAVLLMGAAVWWQRR